MMYVEPATPSTVVGGRPWQALAQLGVSVLSAGGATTVIEKAFVAVPAAASVTVMLVLTVAATDGVPEITPAVLNVKPAGSALPAATVQVYGAVPPEATSVTGP
jgi:hypothetical protein